MQTPSHEVLSGFDSMWADIAPVGRHRKTGGYRRFAWTGADQSMREWFAAEVARRGLELQEDRAGNQWAWAGETTTGGALVLGSHLDSVPDGGAFDGPLGIVTALAVVDQLREEGRRLHRPLALVNFADEEGARFGVACAGSRILTGQLSKERALGLRDGDGISLAEAWRSVGRDPESLGPDPDLVSRIGHFVELHVEQGYALADPDRDPASSAVAVGSNIWAHGRWRINFDGTANHAGTTRLIDRDDAMIPCAQMILAARELAEQMNCVATIGKLQVEPNGVNAIPSRVSAWLDARGENPEKVDRLIAAITDRVGDLGAELNRESWTPSTYFDAPMSQQLQEALPQAPVLSTGAGHDAGILASHGVPTGMLFVRNPTGVSHSPLEFAAPQDCHEGVAALAEVVRRLDAGGQS